MKGVLSSKNKFYEKLKGVFWSGKIFLLTGRKCLTGNTEWVEHQLKQALIPPSEMHPNGEKIVIGMPLLGKLRAFQPLGRFRPVHLYQKKNWQRDSHIFIGLWSRDLVFYQTIVTSKSLITKINHLSTTLTRKFIFIKESLYASQNEQTITPLNSHIN